jgi:STE24 endopeptidase
MLNFIPAIIALLIAASYRPDIYDSPPDAVLAAAAAACFIAFTFLLAILAADRTIRLRLTAADGESIAPRLSLLRRGYWAFVLLSYAALIHAFRWPEALPEEAGGFPLVQEIFSLLPFYAGILLAALPSWRTEKALRHVTWSRAEYVAYTARQYLLPAVPFAVFTLAEDLLGRYTDAERFFSVYPSLAEAMAAAMVVVMFFAAPLLIRFFWPAEPLPAGELRARLESLAERAGISTGKIFVWRTGGGRIMNAAVTGVGGAFRYIFITDALIENLAPSEVEGVFAHELSHARHNHLAIYMALVLAFMFGLFIAAEPLDSAAAALAPESHAGRIAVSMAIIAAVLLVFWYFVFGALSRALEQQADLAGAVLSGNFVSFIAALEKLAALSGAMRRVKGWRHHSIEKRVRFLFEVAENPDVGVRFLKRLITAVAVVFALFTAGLIALSMDVALDLSQPEYSVLSREADYYFAATAPGSLENTLRTAAARVDSFWAADRATRFAALYEKSGDPALAGRFKNLADELLGHFDVPPDSMRASPDDGN